jgi:anaerobic magnesium-protoporphyrin IX monomethyl ester cyclase
MLHIALINGPLKSAVCDQGVGHQMPLGLLIVGGPLRDAGFDVKLIDAACDHLTDEQTIERVARFGADVVMIAHVGSTQAHPCCLRLLRALKRARPELFTVYGGVYPTYHYKQLLTEEPAVDVIVRGEGEAVALQLIQTLQQQAESTGAPERLPPAPDLTHVAGIAWRRERKVILNSAPPPIEDLDAYRIAWELIENWDKYRAFALGRSAVVQFSRGCPHTCTYCGQWMFWKRWRHRDIGKFVDEMDWLCRVRGVRFFWLADENPTTIKERWQDLLKEIARRRLPLRLCASIRAQDIVRDADILHLYRQAGFLYVLMGIETVTDETLSRIRKESCVDDGYRAVRLLRQHGILSIVDYIFGLEEESPRTLWRGLRGLLRYDGDFVNALYLTPHAWTPLGRALAAAPVVEPDLWKWDYRHQIVGVNRLSPAQLFLGVKIVELLFHLRPRRLWRMLAGCDPSQRRQLRFACWHITRVFWYEVYEFLASRLWNTGHAKQLQRRQQARGVRARRDNETVSHVRVRHDPDQRQSTPLALDAAAQRT